MLANAELLAHLAADFSREAFPAKCLLVEQGLRAKKLFYIEAGGCRGWFTTDEGKEVTINFGFEGSFVSSMETLLAGEPSWYNVETLELTVVYSISHPEFEELKTRSPYWRAVYVEYIEQRLLYYQHLFIARIKDSPASRYRALLAQHPEIIQRVPQHYIASFLGITAVSLSRIRRRK
jgi:CRP-like cAMP-binding protein